MARGYFGIGIAQGKTVENLGVLWRSAHVFGAAFIFTIGHRYQKQPSDTSCSSRHIPLLSFVDADDFLAHRPYDCQLVSIECGVGGILLPDFSHPERAIYLLGAEVNGLPSPLLKASQTIVEIPSTYCLNVAVAGSIVIYDRLAKGGRRRI